MSDEEAIVYLSNLRQIGRWSAEMILLFIAVGEQLMDFEQSSFDCLLT